MSRNRVANGLGKLRTTYMIYFEVEYQLEACLIRVICLHKLTTAITVVYGFDGN